jgi:hypothetical protein
VVNGMGLPVLELPFVPHGIDGSSLHALSEVLVEHAIAQGWR